MSLFRHFRMLILETDGSTQAGAWAQRVPLTPGLTSSKCTQDESAGVRGIFWVHAPTGITPFYLAIGIAPLSLHGRGAGDR
jgi:hypothetical protein